LFLISITAAAEGEKFVVVKEKNMDLKKIRRKSWKG
jgi:hypothetical protein